MTALLAKPTIKILLYTDDPTTITDGNNLLGLGSMIERLKAHAPQFARLSIKWVSRSSDQNNHADNKLDFLLSKELNETGAPFDEIWFFGLHQANTDRFSLGIFRGGPESELTPDEVEALDKWMKVDGGTGGGVLMTGDHNNPVPPNWLPNKNGRCTDTVDKPELLGLGRAIGRCVPRAGELRKWDGSPSSRGDDSLNTVASAGFQSDRVPQQLSLELVNADGEPDPHGQPHPLFYYRPGRFVDIFPDHRHEGALANPDLSNTAVWPVGPTGQPKPCVVAYGTDRRTGKKISLVTAYDGDRAGVGRIVADSSWHHYLNLNLKGFPHPAPPQSDSDKLGQYYGNLALWLAPLSKRRQMAQAMFSELANFTLLLEQREAPLKTGEIAYSILSRSTSPCEIHELLRASGQMQFVQGGSSDSGMENLTNTEKEALGLVIDSYQRALIQAEQESVPMKSFDTENVSQEMPRVSVATAASAGINPSNGSANSREKSSVTTSTETKEWTIDIKRDAPAGAPQFTATLVFRLDIQDGVVTGQVWNGVDREFLSAVTGTCKALPGLNQSIVALEFQWGSVNMTLRGTMVETDTVTFTGRYTASATTPPSQTDPPYSMAPGDGDTGSGTGQQT